MVLCIRSRFSRLEVGEVVGIGVALVWETMYAIPDLHRAMREGSFHETALQCTLVVFFTKAGREAMIKCSNTSCTEIVALAFTLHH